MNTSKIFKDVYSDFFGIENINKEVNVNNNIDKNEQMNIYFKQINELYLEDDSKKLLKQIIEYMRKYQEEIEKNYISFQIRLITDNINTKNSISNILYEAGIYFEYIKLDKDEISLYQIDKKFDINTYYLKNGLITITDLGAINSLDVTDKQKFFLSLKNTLILNPNKITIISGNESKMDTFFLEDGTLKNMFSQFIIKDKVPNIQELYEEINERISLNNNDQVLLLDYISKTYPASNDFITYKDNLIKYLAFNKKVPLLEEPKSMKEIFSDLDELVGLTKVKKVLKDLVDVMELKKNNEDLTINSFNLHMVFLGNPGTGKTTVARIIANILYNIGYIKENKLIEVSSKDLVAEYVGQTAPKTNSVIEKALNGVLFIDEAYSLAYSSNENSYNEDAIATLIQAMENHRHELVVIFAGYTKEMQAFLDSNSGITSRIGYTLEFEDYSTKELITIFNNFMKKSGFIVTKEAIDELSKIIEVHKYNKNFGNARFVRNIYEKTIIKHASNTRTIKDKERLKTISADDINADNLIV